MSRLQVIDKAFSVNPQKPGEAMELMIALFPDQKGSQRDPVEIALEVADLIYYTRQSKAPPYIQNPTPWFESLGLNYNEALVFCVLKYTARLNSSVETDPKDQEYQRMKWYLEERGPRNFMASQLR